LVLPWLLVGLPSCELHGDLDQRARDTALQRFKSSEARIMVATDFGSQGLHVRNCSKAGFLRSLTMAVLGLMIQADYKGWDVIFGLPGKGHFGP
jgi:hypothetical protein